MSEPLLPDWMVAEDTHRLFAALGFEARFVGGAVRDWQLGRSGGDLDIATPLVPEEVLARLTAAEIRAIPTGIEHGTVTAVLNHKPVEITTLRRDVATDGRHATVAFTCDWTEDAARRDFTMNALYADLEGRIYDPTGGLADLEIGLVRFIGAPRRRIAEDYLRILRFFRFLAWYGRVPPLADDLDACAEAAASIDSLSVERVWMELSKLLNAPDPTPMIDLMRERQVLEHVLPEAVGTLSGLIALESEFTGIAQRPACLRRLAALVPASSVDGLARRLKLSGAEHQRLSAISSIAGDADAVGRSPWHRLRRDGVEAVMDGVLVAAALGNRAGLAALDIASHWTAPDFPLGGADVLALGLTPGPEVGRLLGAVEAWWEAGGCVADRDSCLVRLKAVFAGLS